MNEEVLTGGAINAVTRQGDVVFRTSGPWAPAVHAVLDHLKRRSFQYSPTALGVDEGGREMISYLPGESMMRPWKPIMFTDDALVQAASVLREFHAATRDLIMPPETEWRSGRAAKIVDQVIRHGDLGPWNTLWQGDRLTGLIDWDFAEPGLPLTDLAQMALYFVPLRGEIHWMEAGFERRPDFRHRLNVLCQRYRSYSAEVVAQEIVHLQQTSIDEIADRAAQGLYPWTMFRDKGEIERTRGEVNWLKSMFSAQFLA